MQRWNIDSHTAGLYMAYTLAKAHPEYYGKTSFIGFSIRECLLSLSKQAKKIHTEHSTLHTTQAVIIYMYALMCRTIHWLSGPCRLLKCQIRRTSFVIASWQ